MLRPTTTPEETIQGFLRDASSRDSVSAEPVHFSSIAFFLPQSYTTRTPLRYGRETSRMQFGDFGFFAGLLATMHLRGGCVSKNQAFVVVMFTLVAVLSGFGSPSENHSDSAADGAATITNTAGTPATITSPSPATKMTSTSATFTWGGGVGVSQYLLYVGTTAGSSNLDYIKAGTATSATVTNLPSNGERFYVTLYSLIGSTWSAEGYYYYATGTGTAAQITSPVSGTTLSSATATFEWSGEVGISGYYLYIGTTPGAHDIDYINANQSTSATVTNLPTNGEKFYVYLWSLNGGTWLYNGYNYIASGKGTAAVITSPTPGSTLSSTSATFVWNKGAGVSGYILEIGSKAGADDIAYVNAGSATSATVSNLPGAGQTVYVTLYSLNGATWLSNAYTYTATGTPLAFKHPAGDLDNGLIGYTYSQSAQASGGSGGYTYTLASGSVPAGLSLSSSGDLAGVPSAAGTSNFTVKVTDSDGDTATSPLYSVVISSLPTGTNDTRVSGTYVCSFEGYLNSDSSRIVALASLAADGKGNISSGVFDANGTTAGYSSGTITGSYSLGSNNNGTLNLTWTSGDSSPTRKYAFMAGTVVSGEATVLQLVEIDDVGSTASGQHEGGSCQQATTSDFVASTFTGNSFAFLEHGENGSGNPKSVAGRFSTTGGAISNGEADNPAKSPTNTTFTGTYTNPNATTGRFTFAFVASGESPENEVGYVIDANHFLMLASDAGTGARNGDIFKQAQSSYSNSDLDGAFVIHDLLWAVDTSSAIVGYAAQLSQGSGNGGTSNNVVINESYTESATTSGTSTYTSGGSNGTYSMSIASNGRATIASTNAVFYFYDKNSAVFVAGGEIGTTGDNQVQFGYMEPQSLTTFTDSAIAGTYISADTPLLEPDDANTAYSITMNSATGTTPGTITAFQDAGDYGYMSYASTSSGLTYSWLSTIYGAIAILQTGEQGESCIAISATRFACMQTNTSDPAVIIGQQ